MTRVLVADPDARARLATMATLSGRYEVHALEPGEDVLRGVRRVAPDLVLLAMPRAQRNEALRAARRLRTEGVRPPRVGLLDRWDRLGRPEEVFSEGVADGYLAGRAPPEAVLAFVEALLRGERPVQRHEPELGLLGRIIGRNRVR